ncbi:hypothetical protein BG015_007953 [Linnemannia schmuckeri]|uniref:DOMON domain-containing protein n=1 Tax=Linnemannia schmuckeri TaxID=64567 RepID=A0A9P5VAW4_9FUNG|nr:hypothetical protein BG015_007953 [Linnemannia schmuckeri]
MSATTRRILILGLAVVLIGSSSSSPSLLLRSDSGNFAYAQGTTVQQTTGSDSLSESAAHPAINIGHGKTERDVEDDQMVSTDVKAERRPLIAVPILVQVGPQGEIVESAASSGGVRFELDHHVPRPSPPSKAVSGQEEEASSSGNVRRADPAVADQQEAPADAAAAVAEAPTSAPGEADALKSGDENPVLAAPPTQNEARLDNPAEVLQHAQSLDSEAKAETNSVVTSETGTSIPPITHIEVHAEPTAEKEEAQAAFQDRVLQGVQQEKITAESLNSTPAVDASKKVDQQPSALLPPVAIDMTFLDMRPDIHAILDASAKDFGSPQISLPTYAAIVSPEDLKASEPAEAEAEEHKKEEAAAIAAAQVAAESEIVDGMAKVLFDQYRAKIEAELESYKSKVSPNDGQDVFEFGSLSLLLEKESIVPPAVDAAPVQPSPSMADEKNQEKEKAEEKVIVSTEGKLVKVNKLNKNHDDFDDSQETSSGDDDDSRPQILLHYHHHHVSSGSHKQQQQPQQQKQEYSDSSNENVIVANDDGPLVFGSPVLETTPAIHQELSQADNDDDDEANDGGDADELEVEPVARLSPPAFPPTAVPPEELRNRGLVPSVKGAYHCAPQFCVNVSLTDDGQFATFHIERSMDETGWISLGVGYAMTTADLLIMWPNKDPAAGGGPRGATLSRRTSHAYVEPQLVSREEAEIKASGKGESLYPENEYILHNPSSSSKGGKVAAAMTAATQVFPVEGNRFIVQFTRPVRTQNRAHKLTPGKEQDFCWAYSPNPISADSVADPGAHITQHLSVGSFAMDVGANQPQLKDAILKQQEIDAKEAAIEKERKKWFLEERNRKLEEDERERTKDEKYKVLVKHKAGGGSGSKTETSDASSESWLRVVGYGGGSSSSMFALQGFSFLVVMAFMWFFR